MPKNAFNIRAQLTPTSIGVLRRHNVVYLDRGLIAINKPSGLITQGTVNAQKKEGTIQTTIEEIFARHLPGQKAHIPFID